MKKIIALCIIFGIFVNVLYIPAEAAENQYNYNQDISENEEFTNEKILATFTVDEKGEISIQPRNKDWKQMSDTNNLVKFFYNGSSTSDLKIHLYMQSTATNVYVHFKEGNYYATSRDPIKATWYGSGHKYATLKTNPSKKYYSVYLEGGFVGSGAIYSEP